MKFLSGISMELYLTQMVIFRVDEKLDLLYMFGNNGVSGWISYMIVFILTVFGLILFIQCYKLATTKIISELFEKVTLLRRKNE